MNKRWGLVINIIILVLAIIIAIPKEYLHSFANTFGIQDSPIIRFIDDKDTILGLDLQGGTQLDYRVDLTGVPVNDRNAIVDGIVEVLTRRVNRIGVSEPNIYPSNYAGQQHIIVELAGIQDIEEAKNIVGKVIQLEFKEKNTETETDQKEEIEKKANELFEKLKEEPENFIETAQTTIPRGEGFSERKEVFIDEIPQIIRDEILDLEEPQFIDKLLEGSFMPEGQGIEIDASGQIVFRTEPGFGIVNFIERKTEMRDIPQNAENFENVAREIMGNNYDLGYVTLEELPENLQNKKLFDLNINEITDILDTEDGFYIVKMKHILQKEPEMIHVHKLNLNYKPISTKEPLLDIPEEGSEEEINTIIEQNKEIEEINKEIENQNELNEQYNQNLENIANEILEQLNENPNLFHTISDQYEEINFQDLGYLNKDYFDENIIDFAFSNPINSISDIIITDESRYILKSKDKKLENEQKAHFHIIHICYEDIETCTDNISKEEAKEKSNNILKRVKEETKYIYELAYLSTEAEEWKLATEIDENGNKIPLTGQHFKRADTEFQGLNPVVTIEFTDEGADLFEQITERLVGEQLAIFVGGDMISAPRVNTKITGGSAIIEGGFTTESAVQLARELNTGAIPAPISLVGEENISATLGQQALKTSVQAALLGIVILMIFLIFYYKLAGLVAAISLTFYMILFLAITRLFGVVITLAGMAGIILSIGMAVDANVLIFERIKEELKVKDNISIAINEGFKRAWSSIRDSNLSSIITAMILFIIGSSIIKGFALLLMIGIAISMYTAITMSYAILEFIILKNKNINHRALIGIKKDIKD